MGRDSKSRIVRNTEGKRYYQATIYPEIPRSNTDTYVITSKEDRYDLLANQYYKDPSLWWVISTANPQYISSMYPPPGVQLRIPSNPGLVTNSINNGR